jgi:ribulose bisphosphate carboxylase small subunit
VVHPLCVFICINKFSSNQPPQGFHIAYQYRDQSTLKNKSWMTTQNEKKPPLEKKLTMKKINNGKMRHKKSHMDN